MKINRRRVAGFTLVEALITISIAAILGSIAIPSFNKMIESNRISSGSTEFMTALMYARSEAAKRSTSVTVCTSRDGATCGRGIGNYADGWMIFVDCNEDGNLTAGATACDLDGDGTNDPDLLLRVHNKIQGLSIVPATATGTDSFTYQFSGRAPTATFNVGPDSTEKLKEIRVAATGRVRLITP